VLSCNASKFRNGKQRTALAKARMAAGRELIAAICNSKHIGATCSFDLDAAAHKLQGNDVQEILKVGAQCAEFNASGSRRKLHLPSGSACTSSAWDDPTDSAD
jgi:hypothetical protein